MFQYFKIKGESMLPTLQSGDIVMTSNLVEINRNDIVVLFGIIIFFGGLDITRSLSTLFDSFWADLSKLMLLTTGFVFSYWNIKSFIFVRKNRNLEN